MYIVFTTSLLALIFTYLESTNTFRRGMMLGFILITFLGCIHYDYGNDYMAYYDIYKHIESSSLSFASIITDKSYKDPGWAFLNLLFTHLGGFFSLVAVLNIIQNFLIYYTIRKYLVVNDWPLAVFIYLFYSSFYLLSFSMMRQCFVICVFFGLWSLICNKRVFLSIIVLLFCSTIHGTALILLPFSFWGYLPVNKYRVLAILFFILYLLIWFSSSFMNSFISSIMSFSQFSAYEKIYSDAGVGATFGIGYLINQIPFFLLLFYIFRYGNLFSKSDLLIFFLTCVYFMINPFARIIPLILRISIYFAIFQLIAFPKLFSNPMVNLLNKICKYAFIFMTLYSYITFFNSPNWEQKYTVFKTIFSLI